MSIELNCKTYNILKYINTGSHGVILLLDDNMIIKVFFYKRIYENESKNLKKIKDNLYKNQELSNHIINYIDDGIILFNQENDSIYYKICNFIKEHKINLRKNQENIINTNKDLYYIITEYIEGITLANHCLNNKMTVDMVKNLLFELLLIINFLSEIGITHRDIHTNNIIYNYEKKAYVLLDFSASLNGDQKGYTDQIGTLRLFYGYKFSINFINQNGIPKNFVDYLNTGLSNKQLLNLYMNSFGKNN